MGKSFFYSLAALSSFLVFVTASIAAADDPVVLGMSTALTGPTAELGRRMRDGVILGLERINLEGGIQGRQVVLRAYDDGYEPQRVAPNMLNELSDVFDVDSHRLFVTASIGISRYPHDAEDMTGLMSSADAAMYYAKSCGRNNF